MVVIGAGLAGLSAACHLIGRGFEVIVVEAADQPGGRAGSRSAGGYRFDTGPTVLTMPHLVARCFEAVGADLADHLTLRPVDPMYRACFADGSEIRVRHGAGAMEEEIAATCGPAEADGFRRFCAWLTELYQAEMPNFIERNYDSPLDLVRPLGPALRLVRLGGFGRLAPRVRRFFTDDRLVRLFSFQSLYAGLAPYQALALYAVITYMDTVNGVVVPAGGIHALPVALAAAAERAGAELRYSTPAERILLAGGDHGPVRGVRLAGGEELAAPAVVCTADLPVAYRRLLPGLAAPRRARTGRYSPSALVWHVGARGDLPAGAGHHNIHFGRAWDDAFRALLRDGRRMPDPSLLVTVPTVDEPSMAPPGRHVLYVLEPVPNLDGAVDWARERPRARDDLLGALDRFGYPTDHRGGGARRPGRLGGPGPRAGHAVLARPPLRPDRPLPARQRRAESPRTGLRRFGHRPRGRRADGARIGHAGRRTGRRRLREGPMRSTLDRSYAHCRRLNRRHGTTYYWSTYALPAAKRPHVWALYGFCRHADDIVDDLGPAAPPRRAAALEDLRRRLLAALAAGGSDDPVLAAVVHTVRAYDLPAGCFERFLGAMAMDLTVDRYETWDDLLGYMDGSAAVIGELMVPILEPRSPAAISPARDLGLAFQLTNFLRDVAEDLDRGRVYLPQEDLRRFGADPARRVVDGPWRALMAFEIGRCRALYRSADEGVALLPRASARCVRAARILYSGILDRIEAAGYDVFSVRARVPTWRKVATTGRVAVTGR